jgi:hypothetical protein
MKGNKFTLVFACFVSIWLMVFCTPLWAANIYLSPAGTGQVDMGADEYAIPSAAVITIITPNGGESLTSGSELNITWEATANAVSFQILYTTNGSTWVSATPTRVTEKAFLWSVPNVAKKMTNCRVQVVGYDASGKKLGAAKSAPFTIEALVFINPAPSEVLPAGQPYTINWNSYNSLADHYKLYYLDTGAKWNIVPGTEGGIKGTSFNTTIPRPSAGNIVSMLKVVAYDGSAKPKKVAEGLSGKVYVEVVKVSTPNGGEVLAGNSLSSINWHLNEAADSVQSAELYLSTNGGSKWVLLGKQPSSGTPLTNDQDYTFNFITPNPAVQLDKCKVKVVLKNSRKKIIATDMSDNIFTLQHCASCTAFTQADLAGTWNLIQFGSGPDVKVGEMSGWLRANATIAANGKVTVHSVLDSSGDTRPPPGTITMTIDSTGVVIMRGPHTLAPGNHGVMSANKQIVIGTGSEDSTRVIFILVKQVPGVTFSSADIGAGSFVIHQLNSGSDNQWSYGAGTINGSSQVTLTSMNTPTGPGTLPPENFTTLSITDAGIVTQTDNPTYQGIMTPDKKTIFGIETNSSNIYTLRITQITGQTFDQADMAGIFRVHSLASSDNTPVWVYDTVSISSEGVMTNVYHNDSTGDTLPAADIPMNLDGTGYISTSADLSFHGQISDDTGMAIFTNTPDPGICALSIVLRK